MKDKSGNADKELGPCPLCGRPMIAGPSVDRHHWHPRSTGGQEWAWLHRVCHKKVHNLFSNSELSRSYGTAAALQAHPEVAKYIKWVRRQPPEWIGRHAKRRR